MYFAKSRAIHLFILFIAGARLLATPTASLSESQSGKMLYDKYRCPICHGKAGSKPAKPTYPIIAGQNKLYLVNQMLDIRDGKRDNGSSRLMRSVIGPASNAEIDKIAAFLSNQTVP